jgi:hypothetical protein
MYKQDIRSTMPYSPETNTKSPNLPSESTFKLSSIATEFATRNRSAGEMVPISVGIDDGRQTELTIGLSPRKNNPKSSKLYEGFVKTLDMDDPVNAATSLYEAYSLVHATDDQFVQPAAFIINDKGDISWSADIATGATGLVLVRGRESVHHLGEDDEFGVLTNLTAKDMLYMAPNSLINAMKETSQLDKDGLREAFIDADEPSEVMRVRFNEAVTESSGKRISDRAQRNRRTAKQTPTASTSEEELKARDDATKGYSVTDKRHSKTVGKELELYRGKNEEGTTSLGLSEMVRLEMERAEKERLAERVEKYTAKVATYEDIAATALAKRMKGRLFDPLTRKNKEKAKQDDLNMHLLEGFSRALDGAMMKQLLAEGHSDDEAAQIIYEHQQTRQEARAARNHDEFRKDKLGSFLDKYANMPKGKKVAVTIGAAAAFGLIGVAAGAAGGALAAAGGIGLAGAKVGKTYLQHRSKIYEIGKDDARRSPDAPVSVSNGKATKRTATQQVFAGMEHDEKKREQAIQKADRIKKVAAGLAAISAVAIGAGVAMKVAEHTDDIRTFFGADASEAMVSSPNAVDYSDGYQAPVVAEVNIPEPAAFDFSIDASTVTSGEGWYQTIQEVTGPISPAEQAAILQKIGPALQEKGWAYPMSDGTWGISRPGTLPKDVLELIKNSR